MPGPQCRSDWWQVCLRWELDHAGWNLLRVSCGLGRREVPALPHPRLCCLRRRINLWSLHTRIMDSFIWPVCMWEVRRKLQCRWCVHWMPCFWVPRLLGWLVPINHLLLMPWRKSYSDWRGVCVWRRSVNLWRYLCILCVKLPWSGMCLLWWFRPHSLCLMH